MGSILGFYRGLKTLVPFAEYVSEQHGGLELQTELLRPPPSRLFTPIRAGLETCYLHPENVIPVPQIYAYDGLPQGATAPLMGDGDEVGLAKVCFDRVGRLTPYGWGYPESEGGLGLGMLGDNTGIESMQKVDYRGIKWATATQTCCQKNAVQRESRNTPRQVLLLRTWHDFVYTPHHILMLRAIITELSLASGGEYDVHFLIHVKDDHLPIWASEEIYNETLRNALPEEFQGLGTLWSVAQMKLIYAPPFPGSFENMSGGDIYSAYRSLHFPLQYFASRHDYDYYWNWEMDVRVTGHYYELLNRVSSWADRQPRDYQWERADRFYIPGLHNHSYAKFNEDVVRNTKTPALSGPQYRDLLPIPESRYSDYDTTDLITFSPLFNPDGTRWIFHKDVTGYNTSLPVPPRRAALITVSRLSDRLLRLMHEETFRFKHTMFPEMYPGSIALHYGLKAVHVPMPLYFDRLWTDERLQAIFNAGPDGTCGNSQETVFGPKEHVFRGTSCYSNANFAGAIWRRWLGQALENGAGGPDEEMKANSTGRMCLRSMILHPIKFE